MGNLLKLLRGLLGGLLRPRRQPLTLCVSEVKYSLPITHDPEPNTHP